MAIARTQTPAFRGTRDRFTDNCWDFGQLIPHLMPLHSTHCLLKQASKRVKS